MMPATNAEKVRKNSLERNIRQPPLLTLSPSMTGWRKKDSRIIPSMGCIAVADTMEGVIFPCKNNHHIFT